MPAANEARTQSILGDYSVDSFLTDVFQKRALFLSGALPHFSSPVGADELAGLACEAEVEARLIEQTSTKLAPRFKPWKLSHGPFKESVFSRLPPKHWTLLVQDVDKWVPEVAQLLSLVDFLPRWSVDDIMISYAVPGGSVGPHVDQYDVFLLQAEGTRRWQLGPSAPDAELRSDTQLKVLKDFRPTEEFIARPGDVLYIPPGLAHFGEAETECLTYSFGFRAPSAATLLSALGDALVAQAEDLRLSEALTAAPAHPAELSAPLRATVAALVERTLAQTTGNSAWLGRHLSEAKSHLPLDPPEELLSSAQIMARLEAGSRLVRDPAARFLFTCEAQLITLFVAGESYVIEGVSDALGLASLLCEHPLLDKVALAPWINAPGGKLLGELYDRGALKFEQSL